MRLAWAQLGTIVTNLRGVLPKLPDAIDAHWMVGHKTSNHDAEDCPLSRISHQEFSHDSSTFKRAVVGCHNILDSDLISGSFTHSAQGHSGKMRLGSSVETSRILNVRNLVCEYKHKLSWTHNVEQWARYVDNVRLEVGIGVDFLSRSDRHGEFWHLILRYAAYVSAMKQAVKRLLERVICRLLREGEVCEQKKSHKYFHIFLSAHIDRALRLLAGFCCSKNTDSQHDEQRDATGQVVSPLTSARRFIVQICDGDAAARHLSLAFLGVDILACAWWLRNGTLVPRMWGEA